MLTHRDGDQLVFGCKNGHKALFDHVTLRCDSDHRYTFHVLSVQGHDDDDDDGKERSCAGFLYPMH